MGIIYHKLGKYDRLLPCGFLSVFFKGLVRSWAH